jgi:hypothetical protein
MQALLGKMPLKSLSFQWLLICIAGIAICWVAVTITSFPPQWISLFFLACFLILVVLISGNVRRVLLAIILLDVPLQLDIHLGFREEVEALGALRGWSLSITTIALIVLYAMWFLDRLDKQNKVERYPFTRISLPLTVYLGFVALSIIVAKDPQLAAFQLFLMIQLFLLFIYITGTVRSRDDILFIVTMLLVGLVLESVIIIGLYKIGHTIEIAGIKARVDMGLRIGGTVGGPNTAGGYLSLVLIPALSLMIAQVKNSLKWLGAIAFGFGVVAIALTLS